MKFVTKLVTTFFSRHYALYIKYLGQFLALLYSRGGLYRGLTVTKIGIRH